MINVVLGSQWGDEGKGKLIDILSQSASLVARCQGGNNAGHTIVVNHIKFDFHLLPSGLINPSCLSLLGNGVVIHLPSLFEEISKTESKGVLTAGRLFVSGRAHLVFDFHMEVDGLREGELEVKGKELGTTRKGIGPTYSSKAARSGIRVHDLYDFSSFTQKLRKLAAEEQRRFSSLKYDVERDIILYQELALKLRPMVVDSIDYLHTFLVNNPSATVLVEGANALMLDLDFGTYPYVTSSNTGIGGVLTGLGLPPSKINNTYGVVKAYTTRVGAGPFPTELVCEIGERLQRVGGEIGVTTGRTRRCGWLDTVVLKYSHQINDYSCINLTKLDVLSGLKEIKIGVSYSHNNVVIRGFPSDLSLLEKVEVEYETMEGWMEDISGCKTFAELPEQARNYIDRIEELVNVKVKWIGVGPGREDMITKY